MKKLKLTKSSLFVVLLYLYIFRNPISNIVSGYTYFDETVGVLGLILLFAKRHKDLFVKENISIVLGIILYILAAIVSTATHMFQPFFGAALPDFYLCIKFWLWFYIGYSWCNRRSQDILNKLEVHAKFLTWVLFVATVLDFPLHIFNEMTDIKLGIRAVALWDGPAALASTAVSLLIIITMTSKRILNKYTIFNLIVILLTLRFKSLAFIAVFVLFYMFRIVGIKRIKPYHVAIFLVLALYVARYQVITYIQTRDVNARSILWINSFKLAVMYFPFGSGLATFASHYSRVVYSPIYSVLGIQYAYGLSETYGSFISDTFWPMVIGQFGFVGLAGYVLMLYWVYKQIKKFSINRESAYFTGIYVLLYLLITSVAESAFLHWNALMIAVLLGVIVRKDKVAVELTK